MVAEKFVYTQIPFSHFQHEIYQKQQWNIGELLKQNCCSNNKIVYISW